MRTKFDIPRWVLIAVMALLPAITAYLMVTRYFGWEFSNFMPLLSDETAYWQFTKSMRQVGFENGYYTYNNYVSPIEQVRYGVHGPAFIMVYAAISLLTGWSFATPIWINMTLVTLAIVGFCQIIRANKWQIILAGLAVLTCWVVLLLLTSAMQESFHSTVAIILAGYFYLLLTQREKLKPWSIVAVGLLLAWAALARVSWSMFFIPFFMLIVPKRKPLYLLASLMAGLVLIGAVLILLNAIIVSAKLNSVTARLDGVSSDPSSGIESIVEITRQNFETMTNFSPLTTLNVSSLQLLLLIPLVGVWTLWALYRRNPITTFEMLLHGYNLTGILVSSLALYLPSGYYRVLSVHLLFSLMLLVAFRRYLVLVVMLVLSLWVAPTFPEAYEINIKQNFIIEPDLLEPSREALAEHVVYNPETENGWCNTMLVPYELYNYPTLILDPGIGVTLFLPYYPDIPKSHYLLLTPDAHNILTTSYPEFSLEPLLQLPFGTLYQNLATGCEPVEAAASSYFTLPETFSSRVLSDDDLIAYQNYEPAFTVSDRILYLASAHEVWNEMMIMAREYLTTQPEGEALYHLFNVLKIMDHVVTPDQIQFNEEQQAAYSRWLQTGTSPDLEIMGFEAALYRDHQPNPSFRVLVESGSWYAVTSDLTFASLGYQYLDVLADAPAELAFARPDQPFSFIITGELPETLQLLRDTLLHDVPDDAIWQIEAPQAIEQSFPEIFAAENPLLLMALSLSPEETNTLTARLIAEGYKVSEITGWNPEVLKVYYFNKPPVVDASLYTFGEEAAVSLLTSEVTQVGCQGIWVETWWQAVEIPPQHYSLSLTLRNSIGEILITRDSWIGGISMQQWELNTPYLNLSYLPINCEFPGEDYTVNATLYYMANGQFVNLSAIDQNGTIWKDKVLLETITLD